MTWPSFALHISSSDNRTRDTFPGFLFTLAKLFDRRQLKLPEIQMMLLRSIPAFARQLEPAGWLCTGVVLQSFLFHVLPPYASLLPTAFVLALTAFQWSITKSRPTVTQSIDQVYKGRYTAQLPAEDGTLGQRGAQPGAVMFAIGATCNQYEFLPSLHLIHSLLPYMENII